MAIKSDDSDKRKTWLRCFWSGNGDAYIDIMAENKEGIKHAHQVRIAMSGGNSPHEVKMKVAELATIMTELGLNEFPED